jgi:hypothetical protein
MSKENVPLWFVKDLLDYDPHTGVFTWKLSAGVKKAGSIAGSSKGGCGYIRISLAKVSYRAHRLAWFYVYGEWPSLHVDHINRNRQDNRISNLRLVTQQQNLQNMSKRLKKACTYKGVTPLTNNKDKFVAQIRYDGKQRKLGIFATPEEAHQAYCVEAQKRFGEFFSAG